jgi:hypothetical protein
MNQLFSSRHRNIESMIACCAVVVEKLNLSDVVARAVVAHSQRRKERMKCDNVVSRPEYRSQKYQNNYRE